MQLLIKTTHSPLTKKEKLQLNINVTERKILESKEKLFSDSIKTLENWKVVD